jgi:hypothetical protein
MSLIATPCHLFLHGQLCLELAIHGNHRKHRSTFFAFNSTLVELVLVAGDGFFA